MKTTAERIREDGAETQERVEDVVFSEARSTMLSILYGAASDTIMDRTGLHMSVTSADEQTAASAEKIAERVVAAFTTAWEEGMREFVDEVPNALLDEAMECAAAINEVRASKGLKPLKEEE